MQIAANCRNGVAHLLPLLTPEAAATPGPADDTDTGTATDVDAGTATGTRTGTGAVGSPAAAPDRLAPDRRPSRRPRPAGPTAARGRRGRTVERRPRPPERDRPGRDRRLPLPGRRPADRAAARRHRDRHPPARVRRPPVRRRTGDGRWRTVSVTQPGRTPAPPVGHVYRTALSTAVVLHSTFNRSQLLEYAPSGTFPEDSALAAADCRVETRHDLVAVADARWLRAYLELLAERGPLPARPEAVRELAQRLTLTADEAGALLAVRKHHRDYPTAAEKEIAAGSGTTPSGRSGAAAPGRPGTAVDARS
ncbi:hypothetical protein ACFQ1I_40385 [Kitasatospora arboriphila]